MTGTEENYSPIAVAVAQLEYKMGRCLTSLERCDETERMKLVRRLGLLRDSAVEIIRSAPRDWSQVSSGPTLLGDPSIDEEYLRENFPVMMEKLHQRLETCESVLTSAVQHQLSLPLLPIDCVGGAFTVEEGGTIVVQQHSETQLTLPPRTVQEIKPHRDKILSPPPPATKGKSKDAPLDTSFGSTSAEDAILDDIKQAIQQMKQGALKMSEIMESEKESLLLSETLLTSNIEKSRNNMREIDKMDGARQRTLPGVLKCIPGLQLAWSSILLPLWETVKHALYLLMVIGTTGVLLLLILVSSRPRRYIHLIAETPKEETKAAPSPIVPPPPPLERGANREEFQNASGGVAIHEESLERREGETEKDVEYKEKVGDEDDEVDEEGEWEEDEEEGEGEEEDL